MAGVPSEDSSPGTEPGKWLGVGLGLCGLLEGPTNNPFLASQAQGHCLELGMFPSALGQPQPHRD